MKVEMFAWLAMASRYKAKHWLHGLTAVPFQKFTEYILGDRVYGIQIPSASGDSTSFTKSQARLVHCAGIRVQTEEGGHEEGDVRAYFVGSPRSSHP